MNKPNSAKTMRKRRERAKKRSVEAKVRSQKSGVLVLSAIGIMVAGLALITWSNVENIREMNAQIGSLEREYNHRRIQNDSLQQQIDAPIDFYYIAEIARRHGYRRSDEILFHLNR